VLGRHGLEPGSCTGPGKPWADIDDDQTKTLAAAVELLGLANTGSPMGPIQTDPSTGEQTFGRTPGTVTCTVANGLHGVEQVITLAKDTVTGALKTQRHTSGDAVQWSSGGNLRLGDTFFTMVPAARIESILLALHTVVPGLTAAHVKLIRAMFRHHGDAAQRAENVYTGNVHNPVQP